MSSQRLREGSRDGAVVRALASHQCFPGVRFLDPTICGQSLLLVLYSAPRGFSPGIPVFISPQKPTFPNFNSILEFKDISERVLVAPWCPMGKKIACLDVYLFVSFSYILLYLLNKVLYCTEVFFRIFNNGVVFHSFLAEIFCVNCFCTCIV